MSEEEFSKESLQRSAKFMDELYPLLVNQDGKIMDGNHRAESNPKWHRKTVQTKNRGEEILVRLHAHHRRRISQEETRGLVAELAGELVMQGTAKTEVSVKLAELLPFSAGYVRQLIPEEYKEPVKVEAGKVSAQITTQKRMANLEVCEGCKTSRTGLLLWHGRLSLCPDCLEKASRTPEVFEHTASVKNGQAKMLAKTSEAKPKTPNQRSTWEHRSESMKVQHSQQEGDLLKELVGLGISPETDRMVPLRWTVPDGLYEKEKVCYFVHGQPHDKGKAVDKDEEIKSLLETLGWNVLVFRHGEGTVKEWAQEVKEALKF